MNINQNLVADYYITGKLPTKSKAVLKENTFLLESVTTLPSVRITQTFM
jgi:hypothetical protein